MSSPWGFKSIISVAACSIMYTGDGKTGERNAAWEQIFDNWPGIKWWFFNGSKRYLPSTVLGTRETATNEAQPLPPRNLRSEGEANGAIGTAHALFHTRPPASSLHPASGSFESQVTPFPRSVV